MDPLDLVSTGIEFTFQAKLHEGYISVFTHLYEDPFIHFILIFTKLASSLGDRYHTTKAWLVQCNHSREKYLLLSYK